jgi:acyl-CoA thioesterase I
MNFATHIFCALFAAMTCMSEGFAQHVLSKVYFFGDSITEGWMDAALYPAYAYPARVDSILNAGTPSADVRNLGRAGESTEGALRRVYSDVLSMDPDLVVIAFGSNDMYIPGGQDAPGISITRFKENLALLVRILHDRGVRLILLELPPLLEDRYYGYVHRPSYLPFGGASALNRLYTEGIRDVGRATRTECVGVPFDTGAVASRCLGFDGQHPTPEGHQRIADVLAPAILRLLQEPPPQRHTELGVEIYPQPAGNDRSFLVFVVSLQAGETCVVTIHDAAGRSVRRLSTTSPCAAAQHIPWDMSSSEHQPVVPGMYFARITTAHMDLTKNVLVF